MISIIFGASDNSLGLLGFGIDSIVEVLSGCLVLWRYVGRKRLPLRRERIATATIGCMLAMLGVATVATAIYNLIERNNPYRAIPGMIITACSVVIMTALYVAKRYASRALNSATLESDAKCFLSCIKLSLVVFFGSGVFWLDPDLWWIDSASAIVIAVFIAAEGMKTVHHACSKDFGGGCCGGSTRPKNSLLRVLNWII